MDNERIIEIDAKLSQLKSNNPEIYSWIMLQEKQKNLIIDSPNKNGVELDEVNSEMKYMKEKYSSIKLYDALISVKLSIEKNIKDDCEK